MEESNMTKTPYNDQDNFYRRLYLRNLTPGELYEKIRKRKWYLSNRDAVLKKRRQRFLNLRDGIIMLNPIA